MRNNMISVKVYLYVVDILLSESLMGYPEHKFLAIGLLNTISDMVVTTNAKLANDIRDIRIKLSDEPVESVLTVLRDFINHLTSHPEIPLKFMHRESCYDCCIKHLTTAQVLLSAGNTDKALANLLEAFNEAPDSKEDYIKLSIANMIGDLDHTKSNIPALVEYVDAERVSNNGV